MTHETKKWARFAWFLPDTTQKLFFWLNLFFL